MVRYKDNAPYGSYAHGYYLHNPGQSSIKKSTAVDGTSSDGETVCRYVRPPPGLGHAPEARRVVSFDSALQRPPAHVRAKRRQRRSEFNANAQPFRPSTLAPPPGLLTSSPKALTPSSGHELLTPSSSLFKHSRDSSGDSFEVPTDMPGRTPGSRMLPRTNFL